VFFLTKLIGGREKREETQTMPAEKHVEKGKKEKSCRRASLGKKEKHFYGSGGDWNFGGSGRRIVFYRGEKAQKKKEATEFPA